MVSNIEPLGFEYQVTDHTTPTFHYPTFTTPPFHNPTAMEGSDAMLTFLLVLWCGILIGILVMIRWNSVTQNRPPWREPQDVY
jgi:hypothetical protein